MSKEKINLLKENSIFDDRIESSNTLKSNVMGRVDTALNIDVHVFLLPPNNWTKELNLAFNDAVKDAVSMGFLR